jgi:hypothetical protein
LGTRKAIDEAMATVANSPAPCGFRFRSIVGTDMGSVCSRFVETFAKSTSLLACACPFYKPTLGVRSANFRQPILARMEVGSANTCTHDGGVPLGICEYALLLSNLRAVGGNCERINFDEGSGEYSGYRTFGYRHRPERLLGSSTGVVKDDGMANDLGFFLCELWVMWVSALFVLAIILLALYYFSGALRAAHIDWEKVISWVETPVGTAVLLPLMPAYYSIKAAFDGVGAVSVFLTMFLAVFTAIMVWEALKFAAPFCEATFLYSEQRQRLTKMGAWDAAAQAITAKLAKSESGFGLKATSLLWLYWLDWKRRNSWAGELPALLVICSFGAVLFVIFGADFSNIGILSLALAMTLFSYRVFFFPHPPEWLKSQPILAREAVLILALPNALRASLWGLAILFAIALLSPEGIGIANFFAFFLAVIALGFGIDFAAQALRASRWTNFQDFPWLASAIAIGLGGLMSLTLTDYWLLGLLLSWAACLVLYLWAKERWRTEP